MTGKILVGLLDRLLLPPKHCRQKPFLYEHHAGAWGCEETVSEEAAERDASALPCYDPRIDEETNDQW